MTPNRYLGGMLARPGAERIFGETGNGWRAPHRHSELCLQHSGPHWRFATLGQLAVLVRGHAVAAGAIQPARRIQVPEYVLRHYLEHGELPAGRLDGSFTLVLLDGLTGRVLLYRNLVGNGFTYWSQTADGFLFGSNLAEVVEASGRSPQPNRDVLPAYFLYRFVPGRSTLFEGVHRLMPGELLVWSGQGLKRSQRQTIADLQGERPVGKDALDRVEESLGDILTDYAAGHPGTANLLSGGVDSSYLQALWNRATPHQEARSFSVSVDHPRTRGDTEYALSAARILRTRHILVPAEQPFADYLLETIAATGEPPNHVMTAYFAPLARSMLAQGFGTALCGEGADSLFGIGAADLIRTARVLRMLVPGPLRGWGKRLAATAGRRCLAEAFGLADHVYDLGSPTHPINRAAVFTDWPAVQACFGNGAVSAALAYRRELLAQYRVPADALQQVHAIGYLGEAMDTASLWTTLFNGAGADLLCPYLDSRLLRLAVNIEPRYRFPYRRPKDLLKRGLARHAGHELAYRCKLGFGQPIFEWLAPGGQLRPWVERIGTYDFVERSARITALARPNWFLYSLLCYDLWHKFFIERSLSRRTFVDTPHVAEPPGVTLAS